MKNKITDTVGKVKIGNDYYFIVDYVNISLRKTIVKPDKVNCYCVRVTSHEDLDKHGNFKLIINKKISNEDWEKLPTKII